MANQINNNVSTKSPYITRVSTSTVNKYDNENNNIQYQPYSKDPKQNTQDLYTNTQDNYQNTQENYVNTNYSGDNSVSNNLLVGSNAGNSVGDEYIEPIDTETDPNYTEKINTSTYTGIPSFNDPTYINHNQTLNETAKETKIGENKESDGSLQTLIIVLTLVILALFSLSLIKLKNRNNDKDPVNEKSIYDKNKPLPIITKDVMNRNSQDQVINIQSTNGVNMNYNNDMNNNYGLPDFEEYDLQYGYDNRMSFLALGDSAIEPRQVTLNLKEEVIKKSKDNMPIPLVHISNENGLTIEEESEDNEEVEDNVNLKAVEPLPGTVIPSKKKSPSSHSFIHDSHGLFKKVKNKLKPNSIISPKSTLSTSSKSNDNQNNQYTVLTTPKE